MQSISSLPGVIVDQTVQHSVLKIFTRAKINYLHVKENNRIFLIHLHCICIVLQERTRSKIYQEFGISFAKSEVNSI